jgi:hypothetical protein
MFRSGSWVEISLRFELALIGSAQDVIAEFAGIAEIRNLPAV